MMFEHYPAKILHWFTAGNFDLITRLYAYPAAIYYGDRVFVLHGPDDLRTALRSYRRAFADKGMVSARVRLLNTPRWRAPRFTVAIADSYFDADGTRIGGSRMQFFLQRDGLCPRIRLVQVDDLPFREVFDADAGLRRLEANPA